VELVYGRNSAYGNVAIGHTAWPRRNYDAACSSYDGDGHGRSTPATRPHAASLCEDTKRPDALLQASASSALVLLQLLRLVHSRATEHIAGRIH
jgi:hypothetical protein